METIVFITSRDKDIVSFILEKLPLKNKHVIVIKCLNKRSISVKWLRRKFRKLYREGVFNWSVERYVFKSFNTILINCDVMSLEGLAQKKGFDYYEFNSVNDVELQNLLAGVKPDLFVSIGNSWISSSTYKSSLLAVNLHLTKLPDYAGSIPIVNELLNHQGYIYATLHQLERKIDSGSILMESKVQIERTGKLNMDIDINFRKLLDQIVKDLIGFVNSSERKIIRTNTGSSKKIIPKFIKILCYGKLQS